MMHRFPGLLALIILTVAFWALPAGAQKATAATYPTPEEAFQALLAAARENSIPQMLAILGPGSRPLVESGDPVSDAAERERFVEAAGKRVFYERSGDSKVIVNVGFDNWPFPVPLVKKENAWRFDAASGIDELVNRRIGRNELDAIETLKAILDAQKRFYNEDLNGNGVRDYALTFGSKPGTRSGLYWDPKAGWPESPLGPLVAEAETEGYVYGTVHGGPRKPYHGYYFRILKEQGPHARGGAFRYPVHGNMVGGFAILAWPADYGVSGLTTFLVNANGVIWQKDLGWDTEVLCEEMVAYDPDKTWKRVK